MHELDLGVLIHGVPEHGLVEGDIGTIVHVHEAGAAFEVEFVLASGDTVAVLTLTAAEVRPLEGSEILHSRTV